MDSATSHMRLLNTAAPPGPLPWKTLTAAVILVGLALAMARLVRWAPERLLMTIGITLVSCAAIEWVWMRLHKNATGKPILKLASAWMCSSALLLGAGYEMDRTGWVWFRLTGFDVVAAESLLDRVEMTAESFLSQNPQFTADPENSGRVVLKKSEYEVARTIVVPSGTTLTIEPGTVLKFHPGRSLISYSPVIARGTENEPIVFTAQRPWLKWGAVAVVRAEGSEFEHVRIEEGRHAMVNNIEFPGTLSLIGGGMRVVRSEFRNTHGHDALYVREGKAEIKENVFRNVGGDGVDFDGGSGQITHNQFTDCSDEGIDLSGDYNLKVTGNRILDIHGGRIAADKGLEEIRAQNSFGYSKKKSTFPRIRVTLLD